jgi:nickel-type superoxide dismutase maturation protease
MTVATLVSTTVAVVLMGTRKLRRVQVAGDSMLPAFRPDDRLVIGPAGWIRPGTVVAVHDPRSPGRLMVKRVHAVGRTWVDVRGDNPPASTDSRHFGPLPRSRLAGRVVYRYGPAGRTGWWPGRTGGPPRPAAGQTR